MTEPAESMSPGAGLMDALNAEPDTTVVRQGIGSTSPAETAGAPTEYLNGDDHE